MVTVILENICFGFIQHDTFSQTLSISSVTLSGVEAFLKGYKQSESSRKAFYGNQITKLFNLRNFHFGYSECLAFRNKFSPVFIPKLYSINFDFSSHFFPFYKLGIVLWSEIKRKCRKCIK